MSERVIIEVETGPKWTRIGSVAPDEPPGMIASHTNGQREAYTFGWHGGQGPCVWKPDTTEPDVLAYLNTGPLTLPVTGRDGTASIRFRYQRS